MASPAQTGPVGQPPPTSIPAPANPPVPPPPDEADQHAREVEEREAYEYWGYLFKPDKTGTDKLKGLLRGLKDHMSANYEPSDSHDLTPTQLAHFYRDMNGNYDQLFLGTPSESIAFIYKSLGCLHSLQPLPHSTAFTDPTVPALKTEGWIMWQTIQLLLGPEEHSSFLIEALQRWDLKDPVTGEALPKILPRRCFPMEPDRHMVAWYEGVSERLRKEAEDEERQRQVEAEQAEVRRLHHKRWDEHTDDESSVDSRGPALAYFRNPLYRHVDGRPTIVRRSSKRPALSPRPPSMMDKGKDAATSVGHVIRNIGSPHLWDGRKPSKSHSQDRDHRRRRSSFPDNRYSGPADVPPPPNEAYDSRPMPDRRPSSTHHHRRRTPPDGPSDEYDADDSAAYSPRPSPRISRHSHHSQDYDNPALLRHSRSHEPTPSQKEYGDYFEGYDDPGRTSGVGSNTSNNTMGPSFGPSASPLFASHVAKQPQPPAAAAPRPTRSPYSPSRMPPNVRRAQQDRPYSRSPDPSSSGRASRPRNEDRYPPPRGDDNYNNNSSNSRPSSRRYDSPRRSRYGGSPGSGGGSGNRYDDPAGGFAPPGPPPPGPPHGASAAAGPPPVGAYHHSQPGFPPVGAPITAPPGPYPLGGARDRRSAQQQQQRASAGSDVSGYDDRDYRDRERDRDREHRDNRERRGSGAPAKQTRFAAGVDGRRYPNESPWR